MSLQDVLASLTQQLSKTISLDGIAYPEDPFGLQDEYLFWIVQMGEHAMFVSAALDASSLKNLSKLTLKERGAKFYEQTLVARKQPKFTVENIPVTLVWLDALEQWLKELLELSKKHWIGYAYPSTILHYISELEYFRMKLQVFSGKKDLPPLEEEIEYWNKWSEEHAALIARLLDPMEDALSYEILGSKEVFREILHTDLEIQSMINTSIRAIEELNLKFDSIFNKIQGKNIASIIHPALLAHIIREGNRALALLEAL